MFDFQISKHPHYDEACRAFAQRHNMAKLAERAGMNVQTLRNKLNPEQPHQFTPPELWLLTDLTEDSTLVDGFLAQIHCLPCVPVNELAKDKLQSYVMRAMRELGELASGIGVLESGITEEMYFEMERLIADAKPASRHLTGLNIVQDIPGYLYTGGVSCDGDIITVYPG